MMFCHKLYIIECINLIINKEAHLLLTVGNKIVTKKTKKFALWWASYAKVTKGNYLPKKKQGFCLTIAFSSPQRPAERYEVVPAYL